MERGNQTNVMTTNRLRWKVGREEEAERVKGKRVDEAEGGMGSNELNVSAYLSLCCWML